MRWLTIALNEVRMNFSQKSIIFVIFVMPLILIFVLGSSLSGMSTFKQSDVEVRQLTAGVIVGENSSIQQAFDDWAEHEKVKEHVTFKRYETEDKLRRDVKNQIVDYGVIVPSQEIQSEPILLTGIQGTLTMSNITMETLLDTFNAKVGMTITAIKQGIDPSKIVEDTAVEASAVPTVEGEIVHVNSANAEMVSAIQYYAVAMLVMFLLYTGRGLSESIYSDRQNQTLHRTIASPIRMADFVGGKIMGHFLFGMLQSAFIVGFASFVYGVDWGISSLITFVVCALVLVCSLSLGLIAATWFKSQQTMKTFLETVIVFMTAVSGGFFIIPAVHESVGQFTLSYWAMDVLTGVMKGASWNEIWFGLSILAAMAFVLCTFSLIFVRKAVLR
ncbi:ABC transporter permease [Paenibacillus sp. SC116]|uniref:ABC transporter permease n=1 Tax=Paenibacillus sp. SC116 TaxID=2968986 RepID=UPI00215AEC9E|nr:ABC transporter permease [Paenibacillus sp. SC116]MCR8844230.1 ABC transporter permease [Paenibacillus sp. SC116]